MSGLVARWCRAHGELCAQKPWEVMFLLITTTVAVMTQPDTSASSHQQPCHAHKTGSSSGGAAEYDGVDVWVMTAMRCGAMLYTYHQFRVLHRQGSSHVLGIAGLFVVFASLIFSCCVVQLLGCSLADLKEAVFFFLLVMDLSKISRLSSLALGSRCAREAVHSIGEGLALLGPGLSLDTCVEALLVGAGSLSGVRRLEQICQFAVLSILVNYVLLMTFFPACLSLVLQMSSRKEACDSHSWDTDIQRKGAATDVASRDGCGASTSTSLPAKPVWQLGYSMHCAAAIINEETCSHNPVLQRVKVIMSAGLVLVHGVSRFSLMLPASSEPPMLHTRNLSDTSHSHHPAVRLLATGVEQCVVVVLVVLLLIKYAMFEGRGELEQQLLRQRQMQQQGERCPTDATQPLHAGNQPSKPGNLVVKPENIASGESDSTSGRMCSSSSSSSTQTEQAVPRELSGPAALSGAAAASTSRKEDDFLAQILKRSYDECVAILNDSKRGAKELTDAELVEMVQKKQLPGYKLESVLQDALRSVRVRRLVMAPVTANDSAFQFLPYQHYDYSKVVGVCCENVVGYIQVPVGVAGPLSVNGQSLLIPMATTEGCLVASTSRGCRALQMSEERGVRSHVLRNGMTRAPVVMLPSLNRATELYHWLQNKPNQARLKEAFDSTSSYARMEDLNTTIVGRKLHLRFLASTGDAMGMNMVSKGVEAALKLIRESFSDIEILSISSNLCTDKKPSAVNWVRGRGKYVVSGAVIPGSVVSSVLKTTVPALVQTHVAKNLEGSALAGSIGGNNAHAANIVAAIFIACGQDPAQVVGSSNCITQLEACGQNGEDLFASVTMPSMEVGTVGGGTALPPQASCLDILGVKGAHHESPGYNAEQLAMIVSGAVLAGELSLMAALTAGHLVNSHIKYNRAKPAPAADSLNLLPCLRDKMEPSAVAPPIACIDTQDSTISNRNSESAKCAVKGSHEASAGISEAIESKDGSIRQRSDKSS